MQAPLNSTGAAYWGEEYHLAADMPRGGGHATADRGKELNHHASLKGIGKQCLNLDYVWRCGSCPKATLRGRAGGEDYAGCGDQSTQKQIYTDIDSHAVDSPAKRSHTWRGKCDMACN